MGLSPDDVLVLLDEQGRTGWRWADGITDFDYYPTEQSRMERRESVLCFEFYLDEGVGHLKFRDWSY